MRARIAYINYTKKLRIFNILNYFCVVYVTKTKPLMSETSTALCPFCFWGVAGYTIEWFLRFHVVDPHESGKRQIQMMMMMMMMWWWCCCCF